MKKDPDIEASLKFLEWGASLKKRPKRKGRPSAALARLWPIDGGDDPAADLILLPDEDSEPATLSEAEDE